MTTLEELTDAVAVVFAAGLNEMSGVCPCTLQHESVGGITPFPVSRAVFLSWMVGLGLRGLQPPLPFPSSFLHPGNGHPNSTYPRDLCEESSSCSSST